VNKSIAKTISAVLVVYLETSKFEILSLSL